MLLSFDFDYVSAQYSYLTNYILSSNIWHTSLFHFHILRGNPKTSNPGWEGTRNRLHNVTHNYSRTNHEMSVTGKCSGADPGASDTVTSDKR